MKYGIDIIDDYIRNLVTESLKKSGHIVIDCSNSMIPILGEALMKKVMLIDQTRVNIYIEINLSDEETHELRIVTGFKKTGMDLVEAFSEKLKESGFKDIILENGDKLYLVKNIDSPAFILAVKNGEQITKKEIADKIIYALLSIED